MTSISIALTTFNGERFLYEQLESLNNQSLLPDELIIVDDGSVDGTCDIISKFSKHSAFKICIYTNAVRLGWRANFMRAASLCRSDLIAFCDQDDIWYPDKLREVVQLFSERSVLLVHHDADLINADGSLLGRLNDGASFVADQKPLMRPTTWSHPPGLTMTFRRCLLSFIQFWPESRDPTESSTPAAHDQFFYWLAINLGRVRYIPSPLIAYRQHSSNAVGFDNSARTHNQTESGKISIKRQIELIDGFCRVLTASNMDNTIGFRDELHAAIKQNNAFLRNLDYAYRVYTSDRLFSRAISCAHLIHTTFMGHKDNWHVGYREALSVLKYALISKTQM